MADDKEVKKPAVNPKEAENPENLSEEDLKKAAGGSFSWGVNTPKY